jgi:hypothetical protein
MIRRVALAVEEATAEAGLDQTDRVQVDSVARRAVAPDRQQPAEQQLKIFQAKVPLEMQL